MQQCFSQEPGIIPFFALKFFLLHFQQRSALSYLSRGFVRFSSRVPSVVELAMVAVQLSVKRFPLRESFELFISSL